MNTIFTRLRAVVITAAREGWRWWTCNRAYRFVAAVFLVTIFYNAIIVPDVSKKNTKSHVVSGDEKRFEAADLNRVTVEKIYRNILHVAQGDYYRVFVKAEALSDGKVDVFAHRDDGQKQKIGTLVLQGKTPTIKEFVVRSDGLYDNILFVRHGRETVWYENKILLSPPEISRINAAPTIPTILNTVSREIHMLTDDAISLPVAMTHSQQRVCASFVARQPYLMAVRARMVRKGTGGSGRYTVTVSQRLGTTTTQLRGSSSTTAKNLSTHSVRGDKNLYRFILPVRLDIGKTYDVCIDNADASVTAQNHLVLKPIQKDSTAVFAVETLAPVDMTLPIGARYEDRGTILQMTYRFSGLEEEIFNVIDSYKNSAKYSGKRKTIFVPNSRGAFMDFRIAVPFPLTALHGTVALRGMTTRDYAVSYSYDRKTWYEVSAANIHSPSIDFTIMPDNTQRPTHVFVRILSRRNAQSVKGRLEIRTMTFTAFMRK